MRWKMWSETLDFADQQRCCRARCSCGGTNRKPAFKSKGYRIGGATGPARFKFVRGESLPPDENFRRLSIVLPSPGKILVDVAALAFYTQLSLALTAPLLRNRQAACSSSDTDSRSWARCQSLEFRDEEVISRARTKAGDCPARTGGTVAGLIWPPIIHRLWTT